MSRCAQISGTMLTPGVSKNGRYYSPELIKVAVARMTERLASTDGAPLTMLSHHGAGDDSLQICGRLTSVKVEGDGSATFEAEIANTEQGRTIAALVTPDKPYLRNVSIRGWWTGPTRQVLVAGQPAETADGFEIDGLDFTKSPGVTRAQIRTAQLAEMVPGRTHLTESFDAVIAVTTGESIMTDAQKLITEVAAATPSTAAAKQLLVESLAKMDDRQLEEYKIATWGTAFALNKVGRRGFFS